MSRIEIDALLVSSAASRPAVSSKTPAAPAAKAPVASPPVKTAVSPPPPQNAVPDPPPPAAKPTPAPAPAPPQIIQQGPNLEQVTSLCKQVVSAETKDLTKQIIELTIKVKKLDTVSQRMDRIEEKINEIADKMQSSPGAVDALASRMEELHGLLQNMRHHSTEEEHIHDQFHCVKCHSEKLVAIHVKCTSCGSENWMGWFPDTSRQNTPEHY